MFRRSSECGPLVRPTRKTVRHFAPLNGGTGSELGRVTLRQLEIRSLAFIGRGFPYTPPPQETSPGDRLRPVAAPNTVRPVHSRALPP